jgi:hypothetical protein
MHERTALTIASWQVQAALLKYVEDLNEDLGSLERPEIRGPCSKYQLPDEDFKARWKWTMGGAERLCVSSTN